jgi:DNA-binding IscR family transcriptional regulator
MHLSVRELCVLREVADCSAVAVTSLAIALQLPEDEISRTLSSLREKQLITSNAGLRGNVVAATSYGRQTLKEAMS